MDDFLQQYATLSLSHAYKDFDFCMAKKIIQGFALHRMRCEPEQVHELMLLYNMGLHLSPSDPAGIFYAIDRIQVWAEQGRTVNVHAFGGLLRELEGVVQVASLQLEPTAGLAAAASA